MVYVKITQIVTEKEISHNISCDLNQKKYMEKFGRFLGDSLAWEILLGSQFKTHFRHFPCALNSKLYYSFLSPHGR